MGVFSFRPANGWRVFFGEVGVIVLGVLIALGIGVIADMVRWRLRAAEFGGAVRGEIAINAGVHEERALVQPCIARRLEQVDRLLRQARRTGRLPDIGEIGRPPVRPLTSDSWELASASEALLYFDQDEVKLFSIHYGQMASSDDQVHAEQEAWSTLRAIEQAPGPISDDLLSELTLVAARLRFQSYLNGIQGEQGLAFARGIGVTPRYVALFDRDEPRSKLLEAVRDRPICKPLTVDGTAVTAVAA